MPDALRSVRARLTAAYVVVTAVFLVVFGWLGYGLLERDLQRRTDEALVTAARAIGNTLRMEQAAEPRRAIEELIAEEIREQAYPDSSVAVLPDRDLARETGFVSRRGQRIFTSRLALAGRGFVVVVTASTRRQHEFLESVQSMLLIGIPLWAACAGAIGYWLVRKTLQPVLEMSREAAEIGAADLTRRVHVHNPRDELGSLAMTFNALLDRLTAVVDRQRRFMADAAHELRTPLAVVRGEAEVALGRADRPPHELRDALGVIAQESRLLSSIIDDLFLLARADAGQAVLAPTSFYLDELIADVLHSLRSVASRKSIVLASVLAPESEIRGDERLLRRLLVNLIENAVKFSPDAGRVEVELTRAETTYVITVTDSAPLIAEALRERIFERFYRGAASPADGAGLGLPIAQSIAMLHGGRITVTGGKGNVFRAELPVG